MREPEAPLTSDPIVSEATDSAWRGGEFLRAKHRYGGYLLELRSLAVAARSLTRPNRVTQRFVLFGRGRSGSTLLVSLLDSHSDVTCLGEIMRFRLAFPKAYVDRIVGAHDAAAVGFKLLSYQLRSVQTSRDKEDFVRNLARDGYKVVYMKRENFFRHALSNMYAKSRGIYHVGTSGSAQADKVRIDPADFLRWMRGTEELNEYEARLLDGVNFLPIIYEHDLGDAQSQQATYERVIKELGLPYQPPKIKLKKVTPERLGDFVLNAEDLLNAVRKSPYAAFAENVEI